MLSSSKMLGCSAGLNTADDSGLWRCPDMTIFFFEWFKHLNVFFFYAFYDHHKQHNNDKSLSQNVLFKLIKQGHIMTPPAVPPKTKINIFSGTTGLNLGRISDRRCKAFSEKYEMER